jgi:hypothetical protein
VSIQEKCSVENESRVFFVYWINRKPVIFRQIYIEIGDSDQEDGSPKQKRFWSYIKLPRKDTNGIAPLKDAGILHADAKDKADILNKQYHLHLHLHLQMIVFYTDKSIIMMIQSLYNKTWTTWQLGKKCGVCSFIQKNASH